MKTIATFIVTVLLSLTMGCSIFRSSHQTLTVQVTDPPHAEVWVNRNYEGESPVQVSVIRDQYVDITVKKEGYHTVTRTVKYHLNVTGVLDVVGAYLWIIPFVGIIAPGHNSLDETTVTIHLLPDSNAAVNVARPESGPTVEQSTTNNPTR